MPAEAVSAAEGGSLDKDQFLAIHQNAIAIRPEASAPWRHSLAREVATLWLAMVAF